MNKEQLQRLKELAECASPGPWKCALYDVKTAKEDWLICEAESVNDGHYIAAANPQAILELIAEIERLEKEANWLARQALAKDQSWRHNGFLVDTHRSVEEWREAARKAVEAGNA